MDLIRVFTETIDLTADLPLYENEQLALAKTDEWTIDLVSIDNSGMALRTTTVHSSDVTTKDYAVITFQDNLTDGDVYDVQMQLVLAAHINNLLEDEDTASVRFTLSGILRPEVRGNPFVGNNVPVRSLVDEFKRTDLMIRYLEERGVDGGGGGEGTPISGDVQAQLDSLNARVTTETSRRQAGDAGLRIDVNANAGQIDLRTNLTLSNLSSSISDGDRRVIRNKLGVDDIITRLTGLSDFPSSYAGHARQALAVRSDESGIEFVDFPQVGVGGASTSLELSDTPSAYGNPGQVLALNSNANALIWTSISGGAPEGTADVVALFTEHDATLAPNQWTERFADEVFQTVPSGLRRELINSGVPLAQTQGTPYRFPYELVTGDGNKVKAHIRMCVMECLRIMGVSDPRHYARVSSHETSKLFAYVVIEDTGVRVDDFDGYTVDGQSSNEYHQHDNIGRTTRVVFLWNDPLFLQTGWANHRGTAVQFDINSTGTAFERVAGDPALVENLHGGWEMSDQIATVALAKRNRADLDLLSLDVQNNREVKILAGTRTPNAFGTDEVIAGEPNQLYRHKIGGERTLSFINQDVLAILDHSGSDADSPWVVSELIRLQLTGVSRADLNASGDFFYAGQLVDLYNSDGIIIETVKKSTTGTTGDFVLVRAYTFESLTNTPQDAGGVGQYFTRNAEGHYVWESLPDSSGISDEVQEELNELKNDVLALEVEIDDKDITGYQDPNGEDASDYMLAGKVNNFLGIIGSTHFADKKVSSIEDISASDKFEPVHQFDNQVRIVYGQPGPSPHSFREAFLVVEDNGRIVRFWRGEGSAPNSQFDDRSDFGQEIVFHVKEGGTKTFKLRNLGSPNNANAVVNPVQSDYMVKDTLTADPRTVESGKYMTYLLDPEDENATPLTRDDMRRGFTDIVMENTTGEDRWFIETNNADKGVEIRDIPAVVPLEESTLYTRLSYIDAAVVGTYNHRGGSWTEEINSAKEIDDVPTDPTQYPTGSTLFNVADKKRYFNFGDEIIDVDALAEDAEDKVDALSQRLGYTDQVYKKNAFFSFTPARRIPLSNNAPAIMTGVTANYMISVEGVVYNKRSRVIVGYFDHSFSGDDHTTYTGLHEFKDGETTVLITTSHTSIIGNTKAIRMRAIKLEANPTTYSLAQIRAGQGEFASINSTAINFFVGGGTDASAIVARGYDVVAGLIVAKNTGNAQIPVSAVYINRIGDSDPYQLYTWRLSLTSNEFQNVSSDHEDAPMTIGQGAISGVISDFDDTVETADTNFISFIRGKKLFKRTIELTGSGQNAKPSFPTGDPEELADVNVDRTPFSLSTDYDDNGVLAQFYATDNLGVYRFTNTSSIEQIEINREDIVELQNKVIETDDIGNDQVTEAKLSPGVRSQLGGGGGGGTPSVVERGSSSGIQVADTWVNIQLNADVRGSNSVLNTGDVLELELRGSTAGSRNVFHLFKHTLEDLNLSSDNSVGWQTTVNYKTHRGTALNSAGHESVRFKLAANNVVRLITSLAGVADLGVRIRTITRG